MLKRIAILATVGATLGFIGSLVFGPGIIAWWFITPGTQTVLSCGEPITSALSYFVNFQLIVGGTIAVLFAVGGLLLHRKKAPPTPYAPTPPPAAPV